MAASYEYEEQPPWVTGQQPTLTLEDLSIDDSLTSLQRVQRYVTSPIPLQRLVHVKLLASTAAAAGLESTRTALLPLLGSIAVDEKFVVRQHLGDQILRISQLFVGTHGEEGYALFLDCLLPCLSGLVYDNREEVREASSKALIEATRLVRAPDVGRHVLTIVLQLAHDDENEELRMTAVWLLNELSPCLGLDLSHQFLVPEVVSLAEDPAWRVRRHAAWNMRLVFRNLAGSERLLDAFLRLVEDGNFRVRRACTETIADMSEALTPDLRAGIMLEAFTTLLRDKNKHVRQGAALHLGNFIATLQSSQVSSEMVARFVSMADAVDLQQTCAFQFPAVMVTIGGDRWEEVRDGYMSLTRSTNAEMRRTLSFSLHEIARVIGADRVEKELLPVFDTFVNSDESTRIGIISHLADFMCHVGEAWRESYLPIITQILGGTSKMKWRLRESIAEQLKSLSGLFNVEATQKVLAPMACQLLRDDVARVRQVALEAVPVLMKRILSSGQAESKAQFEADLFAFAEAQAYQDRQTFVYICSRLICAEPPDSEIAASFLGQLAILASDTVPGIRIAVARGILDLPIWACSSPHIKEAISVLDPDPIIRRVIGDLLSTAIEARSPILPLPPPPSSSPPPLAPPSAETSYRKKDSAAAASAAADAVVDAAADAAAAADDDAPAAAAVAAAPAAAPAPAPAPAATAAAATATGAAAAGQED